MWQPCFDGCCNAYKQRPHTSRGHPGWCLWKIRKRHKRQSGGPLHDIDRNGDCISIIKSSSSSLSFGLVVRRFAETNRDWSSSSPKSLSLACWPSSEIMSKYKYGTLIHSAGRFNMFRVLLLPIWGQVRLDVSFFYGVNHPIGKSKARSKRFMAVIIDTMYLVNFSFDCSWTENLLSNHISTERKHSRFINVFSDGTYEFDFLPKISNFLSRINNFNKDAMFLSDQDHEISSTHKFHAH